MTPRDPIGAIADAILYEGYVLWPYRRSALKNTQRWTFGGVYPRNHSEARAAGDDPWTMQTQCLVEGPSEARVAIGVRFLHVVWRQVLDEHGAAVDELTVGDERHLSWEEAAEREISLPAATLEQLSHRCRVEIAIPAGNEREPLGEGRPARSAPAAASSAEPAARAAAGPAIERSWEPLAGHVCVRAEQIAPALHRLTVRVENTTPWECGPREAALRQSFCSTHTVMRAEGAAFVSLTDPPTALVKEAEACENRGTWPVLVGEQPSRTTLLSSPIILSDYPQIAPESPGDLFDGGEIDQLLTLNILSLTDAEKAEMRASDPRVREILERTERLTPEELMAMHGTIRELQVRRP